MLAFVVCEVLELVYPVFDDSSVFMTPRIEVKLLVIDLVY